jgi:single-strand DNA-binding protein
MRRYELMVILDPDLEERTVAPSLDQFLGVVRQGGGTVEKVDVWGRRRLAFEINHKVEGIYAVLDVTAEPATVKELDRQLNLNEAVLRTNLVDDPELRFTPSGAAVAKFRVASTPRYLDKQTNEWKDGESLFLTCNVWRQAAENVAESLQRGMRVIVQGRLKQRSYETKEGEKRTVFEVEVDEVGPSLRNATAKINRAQRGGSGGGGFGGGGGSSAPADDPWATPAPGGVTDEPPF